MAELPPTRQCQVGEYAPAMNAKLPPETRPTCFPNIRFLEKIWFDPNETLSEEASFGETPMALDALKEYV